MHSRAGRSRERELTAWREVHPQAAVALLYDDGSGAQHECDEHCAEE